MKRLLSTSSRRPSSRRGLLVMDVIWGISLAMALMMLMTVAVVKQNRAERQLAESRAAVRTAEAALFSLQTGETQPQKLPDGVTIEKVSGEAPAGKAWVKVTASEGAAHGELVGLVKADALQGVR